MKISSLQIYIPQPGSVTNYERNAMYDLYFIETKISAQNLAYFMGQQAIFVFGFRATLLTEDEKPQGL